jgi:hypothetical protein
VFVWVDSRDHGVVRDNIKLLGCHQSAYFQGTFTGGVVFVTRSASTYIPEGSTGWSASSLRAVNTKFDSDNPRTERSMLE